MLALHLAFALSLAADTPTKDQVRNRCSEWPLFDDGQYMGQTPESCTAFFEQWKREIEAGEKSANYDTAKDARYARNLLEDDLQLFNRRKLVAKAFATLAESDIVAAEKAHAGKPIDWDSRMGLLVRSGGVIGATVKHVARLVELEKAVLEKVMKPDEASGNEAQTLGAELDDGCTRFDEAVVALAGTASKRVKPLREDGAKLLPASLAAATRKPDACRGEALPVGPRGRQPGIETVDRSRLPRWKAWWVARQPVDAAAPMKDRVVQLPFGVTQEQLLTAFLIAHPSRFVFLLAPVDAGWGTLPKGLAVLVTEKLGGDDLRVRAPHSGELDVPAASLSRVPLNSPAFAPRPIDLPVSADVEGKTVWVGGPWDEVLTDGPPVKEPAFLRVMDPNSPSFTRFTTAAGKFWACFTGELQKLDPDNRRGDYDLVTFNRQTGDTVKVESYAAALERKACKKCGCAAQQKQHVATSREALKPLREAALARFQPVAERLDALFPAKKKK